MPLVFLICKIYLGMKFENHRQPRVGRSGYFLYGNHTHGLDAFLPAMAAFPKQGYVVANPDAVSIPGLRNLVRLIGCIPVPSALKWVSAFSEGAGTAIPTGSLYRYFPQRRISGPFTLACVPLWDPLSDIRQR